MPEPEELDHATAAPTGSGGLSAAGWAAVAAIGAAAVTAAATLVTHFTGPAQAPDPESSITVPASSPTASTSQEPSPSGAPRSKLLEELAGTWSGPAQAGSKNFTMTLVVTDDCVEGGPCGTLTTDLLPCVGNISLVKIDDGPAFDFAVGSFSDQSSASCTTHTGGDYFKLGDDVLTYATGYDGGLRGTLHRVD